jgi:hypothetical protein
MLVSIWRETSLKASEFGLNYRANLVMLWRDKHTARDWGIFCVHTTNIQSQISAKMHLFLTKCFALLHGRTCVDPWTHPHSCACIYSVHVLLKHVCMTAETTTVTRFMPLVCVVTAQYCICLARRHGNVAVTRQCMVPMHNMLRFSR